MSACCYFVMLNNNRLKGFVMSKKSSLSLTTIFLHWFVALLMVESMVVGIMVADMSRSPERLQLMNIHKSVGILVLLLALLRVVWRYVEGQYQPLGKVSKAHALGISLIHWILIITTVVMPISGLFISIGGGHPVSFFGLALIGRGEKVEWLNQIGYLLHSAGMYTLIVALFLHALGTIKYQLINKQPVLSRMLGKQV